MSKPTISAPALVASLSLSGVVNTATLTLLAPTEWGSAIAPFIDLGSVSLGILIATWRSILPTKEEYEFSLTCLILSVKENISSLFKSFTIFYILPLFMFIYLKYIISQPQHPFDEQSPLLSWLLSLNHWCLNLVSLFQKFS